MKAKHTQLGVTATFGQVVFYLLDQKADVMDFIYIFCY